MLTVDLIFYKKSKDALGFLDEEMGTNTVCPQEIVNTHSIMEKKIRKRWSKAAWAQ